MSYALAAAIAVEYDPSHILDLLLGSLISATHFPHFLILIPLYVLSCCFCETIVVSDGGESTKSLVVVVVVEEDVSGSVSVTTFNGFN